MPPFVSIHAYVDESHVYITILDTYRDPVVVCPVVRQMRKYRCVGVCIRECGFQLELYVFKATLDTFSWSLQSAGGTSEGREAASSLTTSILCHTRTQT